MVVAFCCFRVAAPAIDASLRSPIAMLTEIVAVRAQALNKPARYDAALAGAWEVQPCIWSVDFTGSLVIGSGGRFCRVMAPEPATTHTGSRLDAGAKLLTRALPLNASIAELISVSPKTFVTPLYWRVFASSGGRRCVVPG